MKPFAEVKKALDDAVADRMDYVGKVLSRGQAVERKVDAPKVDRITTLCWILENYQYDAMTHKLTQTDPDPAVSNACGKDVTFADNVIITQ